MVENRWINGLIVCGRLNSFHMFLYSSSAGPSSSQSSSEQKATDAPVVPFGLDLYYWGQEQPNAGKIVK